MKAATIAAWHVEKAEPTLAIFWNIENDAKSTKSYAPKNQRFHLTAALTIIKLSGSKRNRDEAERILREYFS